MIEYTVDHWQIKFIFQLKGSVFLKSLVLAVPSTIVALVLHMFVITRDADLSMGQFGSYNFVLGFLIVFRCQQAYSRFWEAASILQQVRGTWFNSISACFAFCSMAPEDATEVQKFKHALIRLASLLYCTSLQQVAACADEAFEIISLRGFEERSLLHLSNAPEKPLIVMQWIQQLVVKGHNQGTLKIPPPILSRVFQELSNGIIGITDAQKITDIPFPFPLAQLVATMLLVCAIMTPVALASTMTSSVWCGVLTFATVFCFTGINFIAAEIEMPFGDDPNDLPMHALQSSLNSALIHLLDDESAFCPKFVLTEELLLCPTEPCPDYLMSHSQYKVFKEGNGRNGSNDPEELNKRRSKIQRIHAKGAHLVAATDGVLKGGAAIQIDSIAMEEIHQTLQQTDIHSLEEPPIAEEIHQTLQQTDIHSLEEPPIAEDIGEGQAAPVKASSIRVPGTRHGLPPEPRERIPAAPAAGESSRENSRVSADRGRRVDENVCRDRDANSVGAISHSRGVGADT
eukprot:TRINITY_DN4245_c0_g1_i2.p1 TRINITY_DN4245_c0_g1~~TRINITY_DN4245_c0_g1_i2.p1  ORF type:complete len:515 (+),score=54.53 TRINITY_DN4245_c0_g1_i2:87-1631(+)